MLYYDDMVKLNKDDFKVGDNIIYYPGSGWPIIVQIIDFYEKENETEGKVDYAITQSLDTIDTIKSPLSKLDAEKKQLAIDNPELFKQSIEDLKTRIINVPLIERYCSYPICRDYLLEQIRAEFEDMYQNHGSSKDLKNWKSILEYYRDNNYYPIFLKSKDYEVGKYVLVNGGFGYPFLAQIKGFEFKERYDCSPDETVNALTVVHVDYPDSETYASPLYKYCTSPQIPDDLIDQIKEDYKILKETEKHIDTCWWQVLEKRKKAEDRNKLNDK